jgi:anti-anti-sigma regulatory factor
MEIQRSTKDGCQVVTLSGSIDLFSASRIQRALLMDLSGEPFALICDLAGVDTLDPMCATVFATVANHPSSRWPATSFLLCGAQPPVAEILAGSRCLTSAAVRQPPGRPGRRCGPTPVPAR